MENSLATSKFKYVVWERSDGFIGATAGRVPANYTGGDGTANTFKVLLETNDWEEAYEFLEKRNNG